jgi:hypothetical protein
MFEETFSLFVHDLLPAVDEFVKNLYSELPSLSEYFIIRTATLCGGFLFMLLIYYGNGDWFC